MSSKAEMTHAAEVEYAGEFDTALPLSDTDDDAVENSRYTIEHTNYVDVRESPGGIVTEYMFRPKNIRMEPEKDDCLIIGFDTEYKPLPRDFAVTDKEVKQRKAKYEVLSYQFHARDPSGIEWDGIVVPDELERVTLTDFIGKGISEGHIDSVSRKIVLVGHYDRADLPAFDDRDILKLLKNVRNSMVTHGIPLMLKINFIRGGPAIEGSDNVVLAIHIRDTILLAPATSRSLSDLGELVGCKKVILSGDREKARHIIQNMDKLRADNLDLFRTYALRDAEICVRYYSWLMEQYHALMGTRQVPSALSGIVIKLLHRQWAEKNPPINKHYAVGKEEQKILVWSDYLGRILTEKKVVNKEAISWHIDFATECYHGGRAEQFWFGPSFTDDWSDYDLTSAYPTAMGLIGMPKWDEVYACTDLSHFTPDVLGYAYVDFNFPSHVRYPTMPVQTNHGILFPLQGRTHCSTPDIAVALDLGCEITIRHGVIIPADRDKPPFQDFLRYTIQRRSEATTDLEKGFWKEITNSCYWKTAQGLRKKRVFNLQRSKNEKIPESPITNPYYAAYITSFVRATVGELINRIPGRQDGLQRHGRWFCDECDRRRHGSHPGWSDVPAVQTQPESLGRGPEDRLEETLRPASSGMEDTWPGDV